MGNTLTKLIQIMPIDILNIYEQFLIDRIYRLLKNPHCKSYNQLLESMMTIILAIE
jgi:hypothetical protein